MRIRTLGPDRLADRGVVAGARAWTSQPKRVYRYEFPQIGGREPRVAPTSTLNVATTSLDVTQNAYVILRDVYA